MDAHLTPLQRRVESPYHLQKIAMPLTILGDLRAQNGWCLVASLKGSFTGLWRGLSHLRQQWFGPGRQRGSVNVWKVGVLHHSCSCLNNGKRRVISLLSGEEVVSEDRDTAHHDTFKGTLKAELHLCWKSPLCGGTYSWQGHYEWTGFSSYCKRTLTRLAEWLLK